MKTQKSVVKVFSVRYHHTSFYGNPSYVVTGYLLDDNKQETGEYFEGKTGNDYACGYGAKNWDGKIVEIEHHITRTGNCIINHFHAI